MTPQPAHATALDLAGGALAVLIAAAIAGLAPQPLLGHIDGRPPDWRAGQIQGGGVSGLRRHETVS